MERTRRSGVYLIRHKDSGRCYVGSTNDRDVRWRSHRQLLNANQHFNRHLQNAWNLYGSSRFEFIWVADAPEDQLLNEEQKLLDVNHDGYNIALDAKAFGRGIPWTDERKEKLSLSQRGKVRSAETRAKISAIQRGKKRGPRPAWVTVKIVASLRGRKRSEETRAKLREAGRRRKLSPREVEILRQRMLGNTHTKGKPLSDEHKQKISRGMRGIQNRLGNVQSPEEKAKRSASLKAFYQRKREQQAQSVTLCG